VKHKRIYIGKHIPHRSKRQNGRIRRCSRNGHMIPAWSLQCKYCDTLVYSRHFRLSRESRKIPHSHQFTEQEIKFLREALYAEPVKYSAFTMEFDRATGEVTYKKVDE
jgi:hypothetical protein